MTRFDIIIFAFLFLLASAWAQDHFTSDGKPLGKAAENSREPKVVVDTVRLSAGIAVMNLNDVFKRRQHAVSATSGASIYANITQVLDDTSKTVRYYGYFPATDGKSITIKSSSATDTSKVAVQIFVR